MPDNNNLGGQDPNSRKDNIWATIAWILIPLLYIVSMYFTFNTSTKKSTEGYYQIVSQFDQGNVTSYSLNLSNGKLTYHLKGEKEAKPYNVPNVELFVKDVHENVRDYNKAHPDKPIKMNYIAGASSNWLTNVLPVLLSTVLTLLVLVWIMRRMNSSIMNESNRSMGFGKARVHQNSDKDKKTTFDDVAGADEEKEELEEIVEFLKDPH